jgi:HemY protein
VAAAAGDANEAARQAKRATALIDDPALTQLLSAQAAQLNGEDDAARRYFEGMLEDPNTAFMGVRGLMIQALKSGDRARALELAERAYRLRPDTPWVLRELLDLQVEHGRNEDALKTLDQAAKQKAIPADEVGRRRARLLMEEARKSRREGLTRTALKTAQQALKADPASLEAVRLAATLLREEGKSRKAEKLVEEAWRHEPDPLLAELYRELAPTGTTALGQVKRAEKLAALQPDHAESHVALAIAQMDAQEWEAAERHLKILEDGRPTPRLARLMARLEEEGKRDLEAARRWLARAAGEEPALDQDEPEEPETDAEAAAALPTDPAGEGAPRDRTARKIEAA